MDPLKAADRESQAQASRVMEWARDLYEENPDWVQFHAAVWGPGGALEVVFPERDRRQAFMVAQQGRELQGLLAALRRRQDRKARSVPTVTVTVERLWSKFSRFVRRLLRRGRAACQRAGDRTSLLDLRSGC